MTGTPWERGRLDARTGPGKVLFGLMYEDASIELEAFRPGGRIFCIASAGCTAMKLAPRHEVVAVDINPVQLAYAERRIDGGPAVRGTVERAMDFARAFAPMVGWTRSRLRAFLDLADTVEQVAFWRRQLDTRRFCTAFDALLSVATLRAVYSPELLGFLPAHLGAVMRARMVRCFERHPNRTNPYARALLLGETAEESPPAAAERIRLVHADAAEWLAREQEASIDGFSLSNILDGAGPAYREKLFAAVKRAAAPGAVAVLRSFADPAPSLADNRAAEDRSMIWGTVAVRPAADLQGWRQDFRLVQSS